MNGFDLAVIVAVLVSGLLALYRGFVKEVLAVAGWIGAGLAALYLFPPVQPLARQYISPNLLADAVAGIGLFIAALVALSLVSHALSARVRDSGLGPLDRALGFVFGLLRGAALVAVAWLVLLWVWPVQDHPPTLREARVVPLLEEGGELLLSLLPEGAEARSRAAVGRTSGRANDALEGLRAIEQLTKRPGAPISAPDTVTDSGYKGDERRALDNLFRSNQDR